jgi:hypothetical protein
MTREDMLVYFGKAGEVSGVSFSSVQGERKDGKARDSVVMIKRDGDRRCGGVEVGRIERFIQIRSPDNKSWWSVADIKWFGTPNGSPAQPDFNARIGCPLVLKAPRSDPNGNYWLLDHLQPTNLALAPSTHTQLWCVFHKNSDWLTYDFTI